MMACLLIMVLLPGLDAQGAFVEGNSLYMDGKFEEALDVYTEGRAAGKSPGFFLFNAGNCRFRLGRFGEAMHSYLSALRYLPRNNDVRTNVELVRRRLSLEATSYPGRWRFFTPVDLVCLGMLFACPAIVLLAFRFRRSSLILFVISAALAASSLVPGSRYAVAVKPSHVLSEPAAKVGEPVFSLREGESVSIVDEREGWLRIEDEKNRCGWARSGDLWPLP